MILLKLQFMSANVRSRDGISLSGSHDQYCGNTTDGAFSFKDYRRRQISDTI
jgi:hypothetical protein